MGKLNAEVYFYVGNKSSVIRLRRMTPPLLKEEIFSTKISPFRKGRCRQSRQRDLNCRTTGKPILSDKIFYHDGTESVYFGAR